MAICSVCKMTHMHGKVNKKLTKAYIKREYTKELANGGTGTSLAIRLSGDYVNNSADYFHVIYAVNELNREEKQHV